MEIDDVLKRVQEFLANLPTTKMSSASRDLLGENPEEWVASKNRSLRAALLEGDQEAVDIIVDDVAHVIGLKEAQWWMLHVMEHMVIESYEDDLGEI